MNGDDELQIILDNFDNFRKANWTRTGDIEGVPDDLVSRLVAGLSSAGGLESMEQELDRFRAFRDAGLTEMSLRLHDEPMEALDMIIASTCCPPCSRHQPREPSSRGGNPVCWVLARPPCLRRWCDFAEFLRRGAR